MREMYFTCTWPNENQSNMDLALVVVSKYYLMLLSLRFDIHTNHIITATNLLRVVRISISAVALLLARGK